ncbi:hypothetical protein E2C01_060814 [Portunus trituberculatus]|uniref:Uncharacterized protein n=1 Tax=Portunus trituberculatus TaxID=210409 RepID=A0A5B7H953_PORTR|nr:hypothetical protein [Portunus trituberculatus]
MTGQRTARRGRRGEAGGGRRATDGGGRRAARVAAWRGAACRAAREGGGASLHLWLVITEAVPARRR